MKANAFLCNEADVYLNDLPVCLTHPVLCVREERQWTFTLHTVSTPFLLELYEEACLVQVAFHVPEWRRRTFLCAMTECSTDGTVCTLRTVTTPTVTVSGVEFMRILEE